MIDRQSFVIISQDNNIEGEVFLEVDENFNVVNNESLISKLIYEGIISPSETNITGETFKDYIHGWIIRLYDSDKQLSFYLARGNKKTFKAKPDTFPTF